LQRPYITKQHHNKHVSAWGGAVHWEACQSKPGSLWRWNADTRACDDGVLRNQAGIV
jgi:hypothetical protein